MPNRSCAGAGAAWIIHSVPVRARDALRDAVRDGVVGIVAVLTPDRLARKYAYQVLLLEEFRRAGVEIVFLQHPISDDPNDQLLLQIQGAIAEYERAVLGERFRRGKLQKARNGHYLSGAVVYVRQSTMSQVVGNTESKRR